MFVYLATVSELALPNALVFVRPTWTAFAVVPAMNANSSCLPPNASAQVRTKLSQAALLAEYITLLGVNI
jgi:hypothetical protein